MAAEAPSVEEQFEGSGWHADWANWRPGPLNRASPGVGVDGQGLTVTIPPGAHYGTRFGYAFADPQPETLYFRYYLRFADDFGQEGTGKLPGPVGIYHGTGLGGGPSTPDRPGWSARMQFAPGPRPGTTQLGYYAYHLDQPGLFGEGISWGPTGVVNHGEWYCVEGAVDLNTPGQTDGRLRGWIDGIPAMDRTGLTFRRPGEDGIRISSFWFNVYFGGSRPARSTKQISFDDVALGPQRVGCGGSAQVAAGDVTGDGATDAITLVDCPEGRCWSVEPGAPLALGPAALSQADVRPSVETIRRGIRAGHFNDDELADIVYLGRCRDGTPCWIVHPGDTGAPGPAVEWGAPPAQSWRIPPVVGDVNGDGRDDLVTRSSCHGTGCWLVQLSTGRGFAAPLAAGDGAYFAGDTDEFGIVAADVDGDGRDDLVYRGRCGDRRPCWRVQRSTGTGFARGTSWGNTTGFADGSAALGIQAGDLDGDGRDDLLYRGVCGETDCWRGLLSSEAAVFVPRYWGSGDRLAQGERGEFETANVDDNQRADVIYRTRCGEQLCWEVSLGTGTGFMTAGTDAVVDREEPRPAFLRPDQPGVGVAVLS